MKEDADLNIAAFPFGNLRGANLRNTNMHRADLVSTDLTGADLTNADLTNADVDNANFKDVIGLNSVKGFHTVKGQCNNCVASVEKDVVIKVGDNSSRTQKGPGCSMNN